MVQEFPLMDDFGQNQLVGYLSLGFKQGMSGRILFRKSYGDYFAKLDFSDNYKIPWNIPFYAIGILNTRYFPKYGWFDQRQLELEKRLLSVFLIKQLINHRNLYKQTAFPSNTQ